MIKTYKILSLCLSYPKDELQLFLSEIENELQKEALLSEEKMDDVKKFVHFFKNMDLTDWQAQYVQLFDYSRKASLHLFEHIKGDSKDRGQAMVDLMEFYKKAGLELSANELPDYLPVFLEFLSTQKVQKAAEILSEPIHIIDRINKALTEKQNPYSYIFAAIISLSAKQPHLKVTEEIIDNEKPLNLDAEYDETPVQFGTDNSCNHCN
jgi:nitrate reductase molybdenum cofactor assembly chaperone NarJ/NarW